MIFVHCFIRHCEHLKGACLHAEVPAYAETLPEGRRYGTQAWQSPFAYAPVKRDCFVPLAMTPSSISIYQYVDPLKSFLHSEYNLLEWGVRVKADGMKIQYSDYDRLVKPKVGNFSVH
jgi:hypothetical protein